MTLAKRMKAFKVENEGRHRNQRMYLPFLQDLRVRRTQLFYGCRDLDRGNTLKGKRERGTAH
jgi:hypothetical protein